MTPATDRDSQAERNRKHGLILQNGEWRTRKDIMVRARYGDDGEQVRRAIDALKHGWHYAIPRR